MERGAQNTIARITRGAGDLVARSAAGPVEAVGIRVTGPVDVTTGILSNPFTLPGWPPTNIRDAFAEAFGAPAVVDNDANVAGGLHWEAGHMVLNPFGPVCYCGARGCWEVLASGTALDHRAEELAGNLLAQWARTRPGQPDGERLFEAAAAGDRLAADAVEGSARWWA